MHPIHAIWDSWEVPLIWSMSREMGLGTINSTIDGRIIVSTVLPMLGWPPLIWDQWYWFGTSGRSCTILWRWLRVGWDWSGISGTYSETDFESVGDDIGLGPLELYSLWRWLWVGWDWSGTSGTYSETDFESVWYILDHFIFFIIRTKAEQNRKEQNNTDQYRADQDKAKQAE